ncbi:MAG: glycosyltransferase [Ignavibacteriota bacterium]
MRILYFSRGYTTHDRRFLAAIAESHEVWYLRLQDDAGRYESRPVPAGVRVMDALTGGELSTPEQYVRLVPQFEAALAEVRPDVVHAGPIQQCAWIAALAGARPLLAVSWGSDVLVDADRDAFWNWVTRFTLGHAERVLADCGEVAEKVERLGGIAPEKIVRFPWGIDLDAFRPGPDRLGIRSRLGWEDCAVAICTRSWEPIYGVLPLLEAFSLAHDRAPNLRLAMAGGGSLRPEVERAISDRGLGASVWLPGVIPNDRLPDYFRAADIYVSFAASDGSSISLLEAMATGLPAIVTDRASNREWIANSSSGALAPFGDTSAMAAALLEMAELADSRRREIAQCNRAIVESRANWTRNVSKLLAAYEELPPQPEQVNS